MKSPALPLQSHSAGTEDCWEVPLKPSLLDVELDSLCSLLLTEQVLQARTFSVASAELASVCQCFSWTAGAQHLMQYSDVNYGVLSKGEQPISSHHSPGQTPAHTGCLGPCCWPFSACCWQGLRLSSKNCSLISLVLGEWLPRLCTPDNVWAFVSVLLLASSHPHGQAALDSCPSIRPVK